MLRHHRGDRRKDWWAAGVLGAGAMVLGVFLCVEDVRGFERWARREARVVRHETGLGWVVPVYGVACYEGVSEVSGAKFTLLDGAPPEPGERVMVACSPQASGMHALSAPDRRALLHRDLVFIFAGGVACAVAWRRRRALRNSAFF